MSTMKRCICLLLALMMIPGLVPVSASATTAKTLPLQEEASPMVSAAPEPGSAELRNDSFYRSDDVNTQGSTANSGSCGENVTWAFDEVNGTLTISGTGDMENYGAYSMPWYGYQNQITAVVIEPGVTTIGDSAFEYCLLTSVSIPDSVTAIGDNAFYDCYKLTGLRLPDSICEIGECVFANTGIVEIVLPEGIAPVGSFLREPRLFLGEGNVSDRLIQAQEQIRQVINQLRLLLGE